MGRNKGRRFPAPPWLCGVLAVAALAALGNCAQDNTQNPSPTPSSSTGTCGAGDPVTGTPNLTATRVVAGLGSPVDLQSAPGDHTRLFVVEQGGRIRVVRGGAVVGTFLDLSGRVSRGGEQGLLGLAFHPQYASNGRFFVDYTDQAGDTHVAEFRVTSNPEVADPNSERLVLFQDQPFENHNGGGLQFGSDGFLYISFGDGGSGGDPFGNGQNLGTVLGKILRIDVNGTQPYAIPSGNPFVGRSGARPEIWAAGLRNPWRFSFDRGTGDLYVADVGQSRREEIDVGLASRRGGENYGWNTMEGTLCFNPPSGCATAGLTPPVLDYATGSGGTCAVTGGYVYRGCRMPGYQGTYFYGDYCAGFVRSFRLVNGQPADARDVTSAVARDIGNISAFGTDQDGELYIVDYGGSIWKIGPAS